MSKNTNTDTDILDAMALKGGWYDYNDRSYHKHQIWKSRYLVASWKYVDMMFDDLERFGLEINEEGTVILKP